MRPRTASPLLLTLAFLLLAGCSTPDGGAQDEGADANATTRPTPEAGDAEGDGMSIARETVELSFFEAPGVGVPPTTMGISPAHLELMEDKPYLLVLTNDGQAPHDLVIEGLEVDTDTVAPGDTLEVELTAQERGDYVYYCSVGGDGPTGHRAQGMQGTLTVA